MLSCFFVFATPWTVAHLAPLFMGILEAWIMECLPCPPPGDLPSRGIELKSPTLQADSFLTEPPGKPKDAGVNSLSLLQGIFLTQEPNGGLLHGRQILYQLSYRGSPGDALLLAKSIVYIRVHSLCCTVCGFWQRQSDMYSPLCPIVMSLKIPYAPPGHPSLFKPWQPVIVLLSL